MLPVNYLINRGKNYWRCLAPGTKVLVILVCFFIAATLSAPPGMAEGTVIRDFSVLSQDPLSYLDANTADKPLLPQAEQERLNRESDTLFFAPWHRESPHHTMEYASWGVKEYEEKPGYESSGRPRSREWIKKIIENAHTEDYPQGIFPAIAIKNIDLRILPTADRHTNYANSGGKNSSFDNFQQSTAPAGAPLLATLTSRDRKWLLVETSHLIGWVRAADIARVSPEFVKLWECGRYVAIVKDNTPISIAKKIIYRASLGTVFPKAGEGAGMIHVWTAKRDSRGRAVLARAFVAGERAAMKPLAFTPRNVAILAKELVGGKYGWGGMGGKRDCSSTVRDIFAPLGILLPRNSVDQAGAGRFVSFLGLSAERKEKLIVEKGVPWRTLLWTQGHIMLYIGTSQGKPIIFHNFWKVATLGANGKQGRIVVGRTAITTLFPGRELPRIDTARADILSGLGGMVFVGEQN
jgi:cell wall-associated NlpC family hydrolase